MAYLISSLNEILSSHIAAQFIHHFRGSLQFLSYLLEQVRDLIF